MSERRVVIAGGSIGGLATLESLRKQGHTGPVTVLSEEPELPYDRPPLSKQVLTGEWEPARVALRDAADLAALDVDWRAGVRADGVDLEARLVSVSDGREVAYDDLVVATGARCRTLPGTEGRREIRTLRSLSDSLALRAELLPGARMVVVGAGFIGAEVAAAARSAEMTVTVIERMPLPLSEKFGPVVGEVCAELLERHGVDLRCGVGVAAIEEGAEGRGHRVVLSDGSAVDADVVVVGVGARPNVEWLGSALSAENGVQCDEFCAAAPGVWAVGDVARWHNPLFGVDMRVEHLTNAREQAAVVARNIIGRPTRVAYAPVPYFWSDQFGARLQFFGHSTPTDKVHVVAGTPTHKDSFVALFERKGLLVGAFGINASRQLVGYRALIAGAAAIADAVEPAPV